MVLKDAFAMMVWERIYCSLLVNNTNVSHAAAQADLAYEEYLKRAPEEMKKERK